MKNKDDVLFKRLKNIKQPFSRGDVVTLKEVDILQDYKSRYFKYNCTKIFQVFN